MPHAPDEPDPTGMVPTRIAAELLDVSVFTIARLVQRGELVPVAQAPGKRGARFFDRATILAYAAATAETAP